jgi:hypothetical protein
MKTLIRVFQLLPGIIEAVKAMENFVPLPKQGQAKLDAILGIVKDTYGDIEDLVPIVTKIIGRIVALGNKTGVFQTSV